MLHSLAPQHGTWDQMSPQKIIILIALATIFVSLCSAMVYMIKDDGQGTRMVRALTWRVGLSLALLILIALGYASGLLQPSS
ncbi:MAG: twin transmembrane helix small protein [Candidatus Porifericomitaceae bacterium WSBS_2022_MAG_OTU9]